MKTIIKALSILVIIVSIISAQEYKRVNESFIVNSGQEIKLNAYPGMDVEISSWDKNEIGIDLKVEISCSDEDFEKEFIENFKVVTEVSNSVLKINFEAPKHKDDWSWRDIFRLRFVYNISIDVKGKISVPKDSPLAADFRYSELKINNLLGGFFLSGKGNDLKIRDCKNISGITDNYGDISIIKSGGNLELESKSSEIKIKTFEGDIKINSDYSDLMVSNVVGNCVIKSRSGVLDCKYISENLEIYSPYSEIEIFDVKKMVAIESKSAVIKANKIGGIKIDAPYSECYVENISGVANQNIDIVLRSGVLNITEAKGNITIDDSYSSFRFENVEGNIKMQSRSSLIEGMNVKGDMNIDTQYSDIKFQNTTANNIYINNRSNPVELELLSIPNNVKVLNDYGSVFLNMPRGYEGGVDLTAEYSEISSDLPLKIKKVGSSMIGIGNIGNKPENKIEISTKSGEINIKTR